MPQHSDSARIKEIKRQEEKLKFIDSLLASNEQRPKFLAENYEIRNDAIKFLWAKEKLVMALSELKENQANFESLASAIDHLQSPQLQNNESMLSEEQIKSISSQVNEASGSNGNSFDETDLIHYFYKKAKWVIKDSGNFDISMTHRDRRIEDIIFSRI